MTYPRIIVFLLAFLVFSDVSAADLFTIDSIKVSSNGANAKQAKDSAVLAGQREAFTRLLERISSKTPTAAQSAIEPDALGEMVQGMEVNDEKLTSTYYSATLSISFNRAFVEQFLKDKNITFTDKKSAPIVMVPVLLGEGEKSTFEGSNPWRNAISTASSANHVLNVVVLPSLRGVDKSKITQDVGSIDGVTRDALLKIGQTYNADKLILAVAVKEGDNLTVRMQDIKDAQSDVKEISVISADLQSGDDVFAHAAKNVTSILESQWVKGKTEDSTASLTKLTIIVPINSLSEWEATRKRLEILSFLKDVSVKSLNVKFALVDVSHKDTFESLNTKMNENGLTLVKDGDNIILHVR